MGGSNARLRSSSRPAGRAPLAAAPVPPAARRSCSGRGATSRRRGGRGARCWGRLARVPVAGQGAPRAALRPALPPARARLAARDLPAVARGRSLARAARRPRRGSRRGPARVGHRRRPAGHGARRRAAAGARGARRRARLAVVAADPETALARAAHAGLTARMRRSPARLRRGLSRRAARAGLAAPGLRPLGTALTPWRTREGPRQTSIPPGRARGHPRGAAFDLAESRRRRAGGARPRVDPAGRRGTAGERGQASILLVGGLAACWSACSCSAPCAGVAREAARSGPPTSPRWPARGRCTTRTRGCSSRRSSDGGANPRTSTRGDYLALGRAAAERAAARTAPRSVTVAFPDGDDVRAGARPGRGLASEVEMRRGAGAPPRPDRGRARRSSRRARTTCVAAAAATTGRSRTARASRCARTSRWRSTAWSAPPRRRRRAAHLERLPLRRRAGGPVRAPPRPEVGRAARRRRCTARHRARPRPAPPPTAGSPRTPAASASSSATRGSPGTTAITSTPLAPRRLGDERADGERGRAAVPSGSCRPGSRRCSTRAAQRWNVSAALLSAQLYAESDFNPFARRPAGAQGIAQFMPGTAARDGLATRSTPPRRSTPRRT